MKYYIDFEATQFTNEIISVGCVDERGRKFYSLVKPHRPGKLTRFITELTGITREELADAPTSDEAFAEFFFWLDRSQKTEFVCYGQNDLIFAKTTLRYVSDFRAQSALSLIAANLSDCIGGLQQHFRINRSIALIKLVEYYRGEEVHQSHNSLEDAVFLKEVCERAKAEKLTECPFPDHAPKPSPKAVEVRTGAPAPDFKPRVRAKGKSGEMVFKSYGSAAEWIMEQSDRGTPAPAERVKEKNRVSNKIAAAAMNHRTYYGYSWSDERRKMQEK